MRTVELDGAVKRGLITAAIMLATIMQVVDMTIVNVALPHMQGAMSATQDQISWVLTSYIVASAIATPVASAQPALDQDAPVAAALDQDAAVAAALEQNPHLRASVIEEQRAAALVTGEDARYGFVFTADAGFSLGDTPALTVGDVVWIPPGEEHWHGAAPDSYMIHLAISLGGHDWLDPVTDGEYGEGRS